MAGVDGRHVEWVEELLTGQDRKREPRWTESCPVGSEVIVKKGESQPRIKGLSGK